MTTEYPYVWLDARYHKVQIDGRVVSQATVVAIGVTLDGERQILGLDVGASEDRSFWSAFLRSLIMRNLLATVPQATREPIAAIVRTIFAQPDHASAMTQLAKGADGLQPRLPQAAALLQDAAEDILAHKHFPEEHRPQLHSTNPLGRLNKEIKRRSNVVGIFPNVKATIRLVGAILLEQDDEWAVADRRYFSAESMKRLLARLAAAGDQELLIAIA